MARPFKILYDANPLPREEPFLAEAEVFPSEPPARGPATFAVHNDADRESLFPPEDPSSVVDRATPPEPESMFAYVPRRLAAATKRPAVPAIIDAWPEALWLGTLLAARRRWVAAASVVLLVLVLAALFAGRIINPQVIPAKAPEQALTSWPRPSLQPAMPAAGFSRPLDVTTPVATRPPVRPADDKSLNSRRAAAATSTPKSAPAPRATRPPGPPPSQLVLSRSSVASAAPVGPPIVSAPPPALDAPAVAKLEPTRVEPARPDPVRVEPPRAPEAIPSVAAAPRPDAVPTARVSETAEVESLLARYRSAFAALDVNAVKAVWPSVNSRALGSAFQQLQTQTFEFDACQIDVHGPRADAICSGTATFVPKVGSRNQRVESRQWMFSLARAGNAWIVERVQSR